MNWLLVAAEFDTAPLDMSPFVETFRSFGVENTLEEPARLEGCLVSTSGAEAVSQQLQNALISQGASRVEVQPYVEQNWEILWRQFFKPRRVGRHFLIAPTWESVTPSREDILIRLDPGQAFGTGDHPTTRMCLELMEELDLENRRVADVGCGSGVLAIAGSKMGAEVLALDIDPVALEVTEANASLNQVSLSTLCADGLLGISHPAQDESLSQVPQDETPLGRSSPARAAGSSEACFDLVISNIISATLIRLAEQLSGAVTPGGHWIVSGIIEQNWADVRAEGDRLNLTLERDLHEDGWVAASFLKR